jgi:hypothetical protein
MVLVIVVSMAVLKWLIIYSSNVQLLLARYVWRVIQVALHLDFIPKNIKELCDSWMKGPKNKITNLFLFGCGVVLWAIWRTRNDWCFGDKKLIDPSNFIFLCCFWLDS